MPSGKTASKKGKGKFWQKVVLFIGGGAFLGTVLVPIIGVFFTDNNANPDYRNNGASERQTEFSPEQLQELEANLLIVLDREPDNPNALQELVQVRLAQENLAGALEPLTKLVELYPEEEVLKQVKTQLELNLGRTNPDAVPPATSPETTIPPTGGDASSSAESITPAIGEPETETELETAPPAAE